MKKAITILVAVCFFGFFACQSGGGEGGEKATDGKKAKKEMHEHDNGGESHEHPEGESHEHPEGDSKEHPTGDKKKEGGSEHPN